MTTETPPINGANQAASEDAHNRFLDRLVDNIEDNFELLELNEQDVVLVALGLMFNSFSRVYKTPTEASRKMDDFVASSMGHVRHSEAAKLILPASASQQ